MNVPRRSARGRVTARLRGAVTRSVALVASLALALSVLGAVSPSPAAAAVGDEVIAWVEVEDGAISGGPAFNSGDHSNFSGSGSYTFRETGMTSAMTVSAPTAGVYPIYVRYAAGPLGPDENVTRSMGLLTNGGARQQMSLPMTSFENWEAWRFVEYEVTLEQGLNTVAIQCDRAIDFCRLNFDAIQVGGTAPDPCVATPPTSGYTSLFDGSFASFDGWRKAGAGGFGRQTDCTIRSVGGRGAEWFTEQQTAPYTLDLDWRRQASNDDSSVHVASSDRGGADPVGGFSIRIGADTGAIVPSGGAMQAADPVALAGAVRPVGQWNTYAIRLTSSQVSVYLNGVLVNTFTSADPMAASGFVGLENRSVTDQVDFKNIQIKPGVEPDLVDSTTSVRVAPVSVPVRRGTASVSVTVASASGTPTGAVELHVGGTRATTVSLVDGRATARVGPFDTAGARSVEARYLGSSTARPSTSPAARLVVAKARPTLTVKVQPRKIVARKTRATMAIAVKAPSVAPTGTVRVRVGKQTYARTLRAGKVTIRLPRFTRAGTVRAVVTYLGDPLTTSGSTTAKITVRKARRS